VGKFKYGDLVLLNERKAKVLSYSEDTNSYKIKLVLTGEEREVFAGLLAVFKYHEDTDRCATCNEKWHRTAFNNFVWYDCLKCGKRKEDTDEKKEKPNLDDIWGMPF
jgi:hypothetical protein